MKGKDVHTLFAIGLYDMGIKVNLSWDWTQFTLKQEQRIIMVSYHCFLVNIAICNDKRQKCSYTIILTTIVHNIFLVNKITTTTVFSKMFQVKQIQRKGSTLWQTEYNIIALYNVGTSQKKRKKWNKIKLTKPNQISKKSLDY